MATSLETLDGVTMSRLEPIEVKPRPRWISITTRTLFLIVIGALIVFIALPTVMVYPLALTAKDVLIFPPQGISLIHIRNVIADPQWREAFLTSFEVALMAACISGALGTAIAVVIPRRGPVRLGMEVAVALPLVIPPVVLAVAWFQPFATINVLYTALGVAIAHAFMGLPFVYLNVAGALNSLDPQLGLAARSLGAKPAIVFFRITLPLVIPGVIAGMLMTLVLSLDELILAVFLGGGAVPTLPVTMWAQIQYVTSPDVAAVAAIATTITIGAVVFALVVQLLLARRKRVPR
jgi:putative spermidine/putrescine transport system permease protein